MSCFCDLVKGGKKKKKKKMPSTRNKSLVIFSFSDLNNLAYNAEIEYLIKFLLIRYDVYVILTSIKSTGFCGAIERTIFNMKY